MVWARRFGGEKHSAKGGETIATDLGAWRFPNLIRERIPYGTLTVYSIHLLEENTMLRCDVRHNPANRGTGSTTFRALTLIALLTTVGLTLAACGPFTTATPPSHPAVLPHLTAARSSRTWADAAAPTLTVHDHMPNILVQDGHHVNLYHRKGRTWSVQPVMRLPRGQNVWADGIWYGPSGPLVALALGGSGTHVQVLLYRRARRSSANSWHRLWVTTIPAMAAGGPLDITGHGSTVWLLSQGTPSLGQMPKLLWMSRNGGVNWQRVASGNLAGIAAPMRLPEGYPTGIVAIGLHSLILTNSPRGGGSTVAVQYISHPLARQSVPLTVPSGDRPIVEAFPPYQGLKGWIMPVVGEPAHQSSAVVMAASLSGTQWVAGYRGTVSAGPTAISGPTATALVDRRIDVVRRSGPLRRLKILTTWPQPLVATTMGDHVIVLGQHFTLWMSTSNGHWQPWRRG